MAKITTYRTCFVPLFTNTTKSTPNKIFASVPQDVKLCKKWFNAVRRDNLRNSKSNFLQIPTYCEMCEKGFVKANSNNLPKIDMFMVFEFLRSDDRFNAPEIRCAKGALACRVSYGDAAIGYVQFKREGHLCTLKCRVCPEHRVRSKTYSTTLVINESTDKIIDIQCHDCAAATGLYAIKISTNSCTNVTMLGKTPLPEVAILEARQEKILCQLAELKQQVLSLCDVLKVSGQETSAGTPALGEPVSLDLVINVNPLKPCYAVQALQKLWKDVDFRVTAYKHSTVQGDVPEIRLSEKKQFRDTVNLSLIWKKVEDLEVVLSGVHGYPLIGESNLLRYIARQLPTKNYEKSLSPRDLSTLDSVLDLAHRLRYQETPKDVQSTLAGIGERLGKSDWFCDAKAAGIGDIAAWSAFKQTSVAKPPSNLSAWFDRCEKQFLN